MKIHTIIGQGQDKDMMIDVTCLVVLDKVMLIQKMDSSRGVLMIVDMIGQVLDKVIMNLWIDQGHDKNTTTGQGHGRSMRTGLLIVIEVKKLLVVLIAVISMVIEIHITDKVQNKNFWKSMIHIKLAGIQMNLSTDHDIMHQKKDMIERHGAVNRMTLDIALFRDTGKKNTVDQDPVEVRFFLHSM